MGRLVAAADVDAVKNGEAAFDAIYGRAAAKVRARIAACHPLLDAWIIRWVYGQVLSAPGPSLRERELCAVGVLAGGGPGTEPLLVSHCRGALRCGASPEELRAVVDHTELVFGLDAAERTEGVWTTYERARNTL
jgi:4-carboxymuconolactone decarboxylase